MSNQQSTELEATSPPCTVLQWAGKANTMEMNYLAQDVGTCAKGSRTVRPGGTVEFHVKLTLMAPWKCTKLGAGYDFRSHAAPLSLLCVIY